MNGCVSIIPVGELSHPIEKVKTLLLSTFFQVKVNRQSITEFRLWGKVRQNDMGSVIKGVFVKLLMGKSVVTDVTSAPACCCGAQQTKIVSDEGLFKKKY